MGRKKTDWIDKRLRKTTNLGDVSALVANDLAANMPENPSGDRAILVIEVSGGRVWDVYSNRPRAFKGFLLDYDDAGLDPAEGVRLIEVERLLALSKEGKALLFDAGIAVARSV